MVVSPPILRFTGDIAADIEATLGTPTTQGNRVEVLRNGDRIFPAMLEAIRSAEHFIEFMTFVYWQGDIAVRFADALADRARAGVTVRVLLDAYGAHPMDRTLVDRMRDAGCDVQWLRPLGDLPRFNLESRSHRKLLVCDGDVGFTGGVGIADEWQGDARDESEWRDTHFRVEGPAVSGLRAAFFDNWIEATARYALPPEGERPRPLPGGGAVQVVASSDGTGWNRAALVLLSLIEHARLHLRIATPYFTPHEALLERLCAAARRGVRVEILLPGDNTDSRLARFAGRHVFDELLECGITLWRYRPSMMHQKAVLVDGRAACVGSANFNQRSTRQDDEVCLLLYEAAAVRRLEADFDADLTRSERITDSRWRDRPWYSRLAEWCAWRFRRHL